MAIIDLKAEPTRKDLIGLALSIVAVAGVLGLFVLRRPQTLVGLAVFTGAAVLLSLAFNRELTLNQRLLGFVVPGTLLCLLVMPSSVVLGGLVGAGVIGAGLAVSPLGGAVYRGWMLSVAPIGWAVSVVAMGLVYFGVITPIGVLLRAVRGDPMHRKPDSNMSSYWIPRDQEIPTERYFRQF